MKIDSLKDLEAMLKVCRKHGVTIISVDGLQLTLGDAPQAKSKDAGSDGVETPDTLTDEELMFWSSDPRVT